MNRGNELPRSGQGTPLPFPPWTVGRQLVRLDASHVPEKQGAPHAFHGSLRAPFHARETRSTGPAGRGSGSGRAYGRCFARLDQVSRACGLGRRGYAPHCVTSTLGGASTSADGLRPAGPGLAAPPAFRRSAWGGRTSSGCGQQCPGPTPCPSAPSWLPCVSRLSPSDCAPMACHSHGPDCCQTVRGVAAWLPRRPASAQGRRLPPPESVAHSFGDLHPVRPGCKGRWHPVRSFIRSLRAAASVAPLLSGLPAWVSISPRAMNSGSTAESKCSPQRQAGMA